MRGVLLQSGSVDRYLALGKSGHPVFDASQQILAVLQRYTDIEPFFAVPQRNEKGSVIDWYSPMKGQVIPWTNATDEEKKQAREDLMIFTQRVQEIATQQIEHGNKKNNSEMVLFGELLQESCKIPGVSNIYLIDKDGTRQRSSLQGQSVTALLDGDRGDKSNEELAVPKLQPVLTFWGFSNDEGDRNRKPLYFLEPITAAAQLPAQGGVDTPMVTPVPPVTSEVVPPVTPHVVAEAPWWKRWWFWLLLLLLLLLLAWLLRACMPSAKLPGFGLPGMSEVNVPEVSLPKVALPSVGLPEVGVPAVGMPAIGTVTGGTGMSALPEESSSEGGMPVLPQAGEAAQGDTANALLALPEDAAQDQAEPGTEPAPLALPADAPDGLADFLNGKYLTRGGLMDEQTSQPLSLHYDFENGKGKVQIKRPGGVSCEGSVMASMKGGQLGIDSQGLARCSDGSTYAMPQVNCQAGAQSVADCSGAYGSNQFPIQMQSN